MEQDSGNASRRNLTIWISRGRQEKNGGPGEEGKECGVGHTKSCGAGGQKKIRVSRGSQQRVAHQEPILGGKLTHSIKFIFSVLGKGL